MYCNFNFRISGYKISFLQQETGLGTYFMKPFQKLIRMLSIRENLFFTLLIVVKIYDFINTPA